MNIGAGGVYLSRQWQQEVEKEILATSTFSVMNRRNLLFGVQAEIFYVLLASGIPCYSRTNSFTFTLLYLAVTLTVSWLLTHQDPDRPLLSLYYLLAPQHADAGRRKRFAFSILPDGQEPR